MGGHECVEGHRNLNDDFPKIVLWILTWKILYTIYGKANPYLMLKYIFVFGVITQPTPDICGVVISGRCRKTLDRCRDGISQVKLSMTRPPDLSRLPEAQKDALLVALWEKVQEQALAIRGAEISEFRYA